MNWKKFLWRFLKWVGFPLTAVCVLLLLPVGYVEVFCRADANQAAYRPILQEPEFQRMEANSFLTYPEWHIVYAYEGLANTLQSSDEYAFDYATSIGGFWSSLCDLNRTADEHGGADSQTRQMVHVIGVSFTLEMALKALYEETIGRLFAVIRGPQKTAQDLYSAKMATDYAKFLHQVPWYKYDFSASIDELNQQPISSFLRSWERRLALGGEWWAKAQYAKAIAGAVAATGPAQLKIRSVVRNLTSSQLAAISGVTVIGGADEDLIIETPRYRAFTKIIEEISRQGGQIVEIAGNDDIMVSVLEPAGTAQSEMKSSKLISRIARDGFDSDRILVLAKVPDLAGVLKEIESTGRSVEHIYDY